MTGIFNFSGALFKGAPSANEQKMSVTADGSQNREGLETVRS